MQLDLHSAKKKEQFEELLQHIFLPEVEFVCTQLFSFLPQCLLSCNQTFAF